MDRLFVKIKCFRILLIVLLFTISYLMCSDVVVFGKNRVPLRSEDADKTISMDFKEADLKSVLKLFSQQSGLNFVASEEIEDTKITLYFENVRVQDALNRILDANNLTYEYSTDSDIFIVKPSGKEEIQTDTRIYTLNYATLGGQTGDRKDESDIVAILEKMLSKYGSIMADKRTNSLIVRDIPSQFSLIERTIAKLDSQTAQVMIEAEILETTIDFAERFGIGLKSESKKGRFEVIPFYGADTGDFTTSPGTPLDSTFLGVISYSEFKGILDILETEQKVKYLARPRILSLNNETAKIDIATWATIGLESEYDEGRLITTSGEREWVGTKLEVTPHINQEGFITMEVRPEVSRTGPTQLGGENIDNYLDIFKKSAEAKVMVKDGETVVIGGLTKEKEEKTKRKVPFLGDIPILGWLFKDSKKDDEKVELVIFITPHIIKTADYELSDTIEKSKKIIREVSEESFDIEEVKDIKVEEEKVKKKESKEAVEKKRSREEEIDWVLNQMSKEEER